MKNEILAQIAQVLGGVLSTALVTVLIGFRTWLKRKTIKFFFSRKGKISTEMIMVLRKGIEFDFDRILRNSKIDRIRISKRYKNGREVINVLYEHRLNADSAINDFDGTHIKLYQNYYDDLKRDKFIALENTNQENCSYKPFCALLRRSGIKAYYSMTLYNDYIVSFDIVNSKVILSQDEINNLQSDIMKIENTLSFILK